MKEGFLNMTQAERDALLEAQARELLETLVQQDTRELAAWLDDKGWKPQRAGLACLVLALQIVKDAPMPEIDRATLVLYFVRFAVAAEKGDQ